MKKILLPILMLIFITGCVKSNGGEKMVDLSGKKVLMVIAPENFRDEEYLTPKEVLEGYGAEITTASKGVETAKGMLGATAKVDMDIDDANAKSYDAVIFVGGTGASIYFDDSKAHSIAKEAHNSGKIVCAICIAPSTLANAGMLDGKKATAWSSEQSNLESKGATYTGESVTQDGNIITANGPTAAKAFGEKIAEALK